MPDSVQIGITSTYSGTGVSSAISDMQRLENAGKSLSTANVSATSIMDGWTKSQYAAAQAGSNLTNKAIELSKAVNSGSMTIGQASEAYKRYTAEQKNAVWQTMSFSEKYGIVSKQVNEGVIAFGKQAAAFGAVAVSIGYAGKQVYDFARAGAVIDYTSEKFDRLARSVGSTGDAFLSDLRVATRGTVNDFDLLKQGSDLLQLGLAGSTTEATRLSRVMTALGMDTGELTLALANQSKRRLDQLGLSLTKFNEIEARLKAGGMNNQDAFKEAFMQTAEQTVVTTGNRADSAMGDYMRLEAGAQNVINNAKQSVARSQIVTDAANVFQAMNAVQRGDMQWTGNILELMFGSGPVLRNTQAQDVSSLWSTQGNITGYDIGGKAKTEGITGLSALQSYTAQAYAYQNRAASGASQAGLEGAPVAAPPDYGAMLAGGQDLTKMTESYNQKVIELNQSLSDESAKLEFMTRMYGQNSTKVEEQRQKVEELKSGITELGDSMESASEQFALGMLKSKDATDEQQYAFAKAAGLITDNAAKMYDVNNKLADAYLSGKINAAEYAEGVDNLQSVISKMDGAQANAYVDIWIREHYTGTGSGAAYLGLNANTTTTNSSIEQLRANTGGGRWTGGELYEDKPTIVGDAPGGGWTPYTEVIWNGYVFNASQAKMLREAGLLEGAAAMSYGSTDYIRPKSTSSSLKRKVFSPTARSSTSRAGASYRSTRASGLNAGYSGATTQDDGSAADVVSETASDIATQAMNISQQGATQTQAVANNIQQSTAQTVGAQQQMQTAVVEKLDEVVTAIKGQADKNDLYAIFKGANQTSI